MGSRRPVPLLVALAALIGSGCTIQAGSATDFDAIKDTHGIGFEAGATGGGPGKTDGEAGGPDASPGGDAAPVDLYDVDSPAGSVAALQLQALEAGCDEGGIVDLAEGASIASAVVTSPGFSASSTGLQGYYVGDPGGGPFSGIQLVFDAEPVVSLAPGDVLDVTGTLEEAWCNTQLHAGSWTVTPAGAAVPAPTLVDAAATGDWEPWEGVLVTLEDVTVLEHYTSNPNKGQYLLTGGIYASFDFAIGTDFFLSLDVGSRYDLTGLVRYSFGGFRLNPRTQADVVYLGLAGGGGDEPDATTDGDQTGGDQTGGGEPTLTAIPTIQQSAASAGCQSASIQNFDDGLTVEGVVVVEGWELTNSLNGYVLSDGSSDPWSAIVLAVDDDLDGGWAVGDRLRVTGGHLEFYCTTELSVDAVELLATGEETPAPIPVADLLPDAESWEGALIEVSDVTVTANGSWSNYGEVETDGGFLVDDWVMGAGVIPKPEVGTTWSTVRGVVSYNFGKYRVNPRSADDLVVAETR